MKRIKTILALILLSCLVMSDVFAQDISTQGTDFWVSFIGNGFKTRYPNIGSPYTWLRIQLIVSAKRDCQCTVSNPNTGYSRSFQVEANNPYLYDNIPWEEAYMELNEYGIALSKGLHVIADDTVSVYCANIAEVSFDASYVLPTPALGDDYIIQTYDQSNGPSGNYYNYCTSAFVIVATEAGQTTIDITPSTTTYDGHSPGTEYTITLQQGEAYQVRSTVGHDLSGTRVTARDCKKIAVFNGNNLTQVPQGGNDSDCIFEQAMPLTAWGKKFVVTASLGRQLNDYVKITSAFDNNEILKNGEPFTVLGAGESITYELRQADRSCFIEASASCAVYLYNHSADGYAGVAGDGAPSMVWIAPIEQRIDEITFSTFNYESEYNTHIDDHYVNIIVSAEDINNVYLDNRLLPAGDFEAIPGTDAYRFIRRGVEHGSHHLSCSNGFNAHVYGFGRARGYAYMVGSKATDLSTTLTIDDVVVSHGDTLTHCSLTPMHFEADINYSNYEVLWNLGDGSTSTATSFVHTFTEHRLYQVSFTITTQENPCMGSTSVTTVFYIDMQNAPGQDFVDEVCFSGPGVYTENGFNLPYDHPGVYTDSYSFTTENGCDSIITLTLNVSEILDGDIQYESGHCDAFEWNGNTYTESGIYNDTVLTPSGCYSISHLDLELDFTPNPTDIYPADPANTAPHWVVTATEFQINSYDFTLHDINPSCEWDTVEWSLEDDVTWVIEPFGPKTQSCKIYVLNRIEDTVWLHAKVINGCHPEGVDRRYWLVCSFYGIDDGLSSPGAFDVLPNPNHGQMTLDLKHLTGDISLKVYDMKGTLVDTQRYLNHDEAYTLSYTLPQTTPGIYLFTLHAKEGTVTKKIVLF